MSWPRAFIPVPLSWLQVEPADVSRSPKATPEQLRDWMAAVPEIYRMQCRGVTDTDFQRAGQAPPNTPERAIGDTYCHLFSASPSSQPLRADFVDGRGLVVQAGQHRVLAAREEGVPFVPVHVSAPDWEHIEKLRNACESEVRKAGTDFQQVPELHRRHDEHIYGQDRERPLEQHRGRERLEPERERDWLHPERER